jgi:hypothetical protein
MTPLPVSFDIGTLFTWFNQRKKTEREAVVQYLDSMADDARTSAEFWSERLREVSGKRHNEARLDRNVEHCCYHLDHFYEDSSSVSARLSDDVRYELLQRLGGYLRTRNIAREVYQDVARRLQFSISLDQSSLLEAEKIAALLNRDAAALKSLIAKLRAQ